MMVRAADVQPVVIAQFSDLHVMAAGMQGRQGIDTSAGLARCIAHLQALDCRPDVLVASGDLVNTGTVDEYRRLRDLLDGLPCPLLLMPGNHDRRAALRQVFGDHAYLGGSGTMQYCHDVRGLRLLALDTVVEGEESGHLDDAQLRWLEHLLQQHPRQPAMIFMHHPPVPTGFPRMDGIALAESSAAQLARIVAAHPQVQAVACGHVHRSVQTVWQNICVTVCPSTAFQARLRLRSGPFEASLTEPPAYQMHRWDGAVLVTHTLAA